MTGLPAPAGPGEAVETDAGVPGETSEAADPVVSLVSLLDAHAAACSFVSALLLDPPDARLAERLRAADPAESWPLADGVDPGRDQGLALLTAWADRVVADSGTTSGTDSTTRGSTDRGSVAATAAEYVRLFQGPGHVPVCPYESVHREEEHLTFGDATVAVRGWYSRYGVAAPRPYVEPDDHIGLELAFVAHLCLAALEAGEVGNQARAAAVVDDLRAFLREHLLVWVDAVAGALGQHTSDELYSGVGLLLSSTCRSLSATFC